MSSLFGSVLRSECCQEDFTTLLVSWEVINHDFRQQRAMQGIGQRCKMQPQSNLGGLCFFSEVGSFAGSLSYSF